MLNRENYRMMKVTAVRVTVNDEGQIRPSIKKGLCLIDLTHIKSVFQYEGEEEVEIETKGGAVFTAKGIDIFELKTTLERLNNLNY